MLFLCRFFCIIIMFKTLEFTKCLFLSNKFLLILLLPWIFFGFILNRYKVECYVCIIATLSILGNKYVGFCAKTFSVQDSNEATHHNNV